MKKRKIYAEYIEPEALAQFESAIEQPFTIRGVLLPDVHTGYSLPIGSVIATDSVIVPAWVGYDIGCGMCAIPTTFKKEDVVACSASIFNGIYKKVPTGFAHNLHATSWDRSNIACTPFLDAIYLEGGAKQLGSLGSGNHFIEIGYDEDNRIWIVIHSGSRNIGHKTATHYMKLVSGDGKAREGHFAFGIESDYGKNYIRDMNFCLEFALENRMQIALKVESVIQSFMAGDCEYNELINRNHNHAELYEDMWVHRKGATHSLKDMMGVIPGNMRDGSFIVKGKGNPESLWSSSHGAGRVMGRKQAKETLDEEYFVQQMHEIACKTLDNLDESPMAYKNIFEVMDLQKDLVDIVHHIRPIINIKG